MLKTLTTSSVYRKHSQAPYIRLSGQWLRAAGIEIGTRISVQVNAAGILITPAPAEPQYAVTIHDQGDNHHVSTTHHNRTAATRRYRTRRYALGIVNL